MKKILFRCDSSSTIGLGHVKRCLVLAKRLKEQNNKLEISFATLDLNGNINTEILKHGFNVRILKDNKKTSLNHILKESNIDLIIIDSYEIDFIYEEQLKIQNKNLKILSFDDMLKSHKSDIVLNHGIQAKKSDYKKIISKNCKLFCGSEYTLLRDEFFESRKEKIAKNSVAIILGGNDVLNLSSKIADLLLEINNKYKITVITTSVNSNIKELKENHNIELLVDINNIASILKSKSLVITASGGTFFEVLSLKKKFINIEVAKNQKVISKFLKKKNIKTTIKAKNLTKKNLEEKIEYIKENNIYKKLNLKFSKDKLVKKILEELR